MMGIYLSFTGLVDTGLSRTCRLVGCLEVSGTAIAQTRVQSFSVVEDLDVVMDANLAPRT